MSTTEVNKCHLCDQPGTLRCSKCKLVYYCSAKHQNLLWKPHHKARCCKPLNEYYLSEITRKESDLYVKTRDLSFNVNSLRGSALRIGDFYLVPPMLHDGLQSLEGDASLGTVEEALLKKIPYRNVFEYFWKSLHLDGIPLHDQNLAIAALRAHLDINASPKIEEKYSTKTSTSPPSLPFSDLHNFIEFFDDSDFPKEIISLVMSELILYRGIFNIPITEIEGLNNSLSYQAVSINRLKGFLNTMWNNPVKTDGEILFMLENVITEFTVRKAISNLDVNDMAEVVQVKEANKLARIRFLETWPKDLIVTPDEVEEEKVEEV